MRDHRSRSSSKPAADSNTQYAAPRTRTRTRTSTSTVSNLIRAWPELTPSIAVSIAVPLAMTLTTAHYYCLLSRAPSPK